MEKERDIEAVKDFFLVEKSGDVVILRSHGNAFSFATDLNHNETLLSFFDDLSQLNSVKVIVIISSHNRTGSEEYLHFAQRLKTCDWEREVLLKRFCNTINQLILKIVDLDKIVIHANSGSVISLLLNLSLACDYRIAADNTVYQNPYLEVDLLPIGGGPFFLSRRLGLSKAYEVLLNQRDIPAIEAMKLGIVDKVVPEQKLEELTLKFAQWFSRKPAHSLAGIKKLLNYSLLGLKEYLEFETLELVRTVQSKDSLDADLSTPERRPEGLRALGTESPR